MAIRVTNLLNSMQVIPGVSGPPFQPREIRNIQYIEYDAFINNRDITSAINNKSIAVHNLDDMDIKYESEWDKVPKLELGDYSIWIDSTGKPRIVDGTPTSDTDGDAFGGSEEFEQVYSDVAIVNGLSFLQVRNSLFQSRVKNRSLGTWDSVFKYCYWSFWWKSTSVWSVPLQFSTANDFFTWLETNLPIAGSSYNTNFKLRAYEVIDTQDVFPQTVQHRNSLVASIVGRGRWSRRSQQADRSGVDYNFNAPRHYLNFYGELGQRLVEADLGVLPATNNDKIVWHTQRNRTSWNFPKVGSYINLTGMVNARGAVWDNGIVNWVTPAPAGLYVVENPIVLQEFEKSGLLGIDTSPSPEWRTFSTDSVSALVFPVHALTNPDQKAYVLYPHGADTFITEYFDLADYELVLKLIYRNTYSPIYVEMPTPQQSDQDEFHMWSHFPNGGGTSVLIRRKYGAFQYVSGTDNNMYPTKVLMARRNKLTGARSRWYPLYTIKRRIPYAAIRIEPSR